jgi:hypothetical protein
MLKVTPRQFGQALTHAFEKRRMRPLFGWGPPGVAKTAIATQVAEQFGVPIIDWRLGQLTPGDLKGLPVVDHENRQTRYYPPEELPTGGEGILLLDEFPQAVPVMQGLAQQLLLGRRLGTYHLPDGWLVIGLGNRKEDRASVFDMPSQVENRFKHYLITADIDDWSRWAYRTNEIHEHVLAFLAFRPELLHKPDMTSRAWPSPRSWQMASEGYSDGQSIIPSVGEGPGLEFEAFLKVYKSLPDLERILEGKGDTLKLPKEKSAQYALVTGLALRSNDAEQTAHAFTWLHRLAAEEWVQLYLATTLARADELGRRGVISQAFTRIPEALKYVGHLSRLADPHRTAA